MNIAAKPYRFAPPARRRQAGFSLIDLGLWALAVVAIVGVIIYFSGQSGDRTKELKDTAAIGDVVKALHGLAETNNGVFTNITTDTAEKNNVYPPAFTQTYAATGKVLNYWGGQVTNTANAADPTQDDLSWGNVPQGDACTKEALVLGTQATAVKVNGTLVTDVPSATAQCQNAANTIVWTHH